MGKQVFDMHLTDEKQGVDKSMNNYAYRMTSWV